jgi:hypothetical protein
MGSESKIGELFTCNFSLRTHPFSAEILIEYCISVPGSLRNLIVTKNWIVCSSEVER